MHNVRHGQRYVVTPPLRALTAPREGQRSRAGSSPRIATGLRAGFTSVLAAALAAGGMLSAGSPAAGSSRPNNSGSQSSIGSLLGTGSQLGGGELRQYDGGAPAAPAARAGALGSHSILIQPVYWGDSEPAALDNAAIGAQVRDTSAYLRTTSASQITATLNQVRPWARITLTDAEAAACDVGAIERAARAVAPAQPGSRHHFTIVFPESAACQFGTLASRGLTPAGDGVAFVNGPARLAWPHMAFGIGSNAGLGLANSLDCWTDAAHTEPVPLSGYCREQTGGDPWELMGWWPYGKIGTLSGGSLRRLGVFSAEDFPEVTPGTGQFAFIRPVSAYTGQRGFGVTLGMERYTVEYRTPSGLDNWIDDATMTDPQGVTRSDPGGGVIVRYQDVGSDTPANAYVLDFHPDGKVESTRRHPGLEAGESWISPHGVMRLEVLSTTSAGANIKIDFPGIDKVERWSGVDRYAASATISARSYDPGVAVAYIASGEVFADALSGAPVAGKDKGPILLTDDQKLSGAVMTELRRLQPGRIVVLGGPATVSESVASKLADFTTGEVTRWAGPDRYATSATISANSFAPGAATVYIASGQVYTDALSGAPVAGKNASPVLLTDTDRIPGAIVTELQRLQPGRILIMGGVNTITAAVERQLRGYTSGSVTRVSGADRFATSAAISAANYGPGTAVLYVASGRGFPDALSGAPVAGMTRGPILLVDTAEVPRVVANEITRLQPQRIVLLGGPNTVTESVRAILGSYLP